MKWMVVSQYTDFGFYSASCILQHFFSRVHTNIHVESIIKSCILDQEQHVLCFSVQGFQVVDLRISLLMYQNITYSLVTLHIHK